MAIPRIFVSSTCYDLNEIRDTLHSFIESMGYLPCFSDRNDVFYHPDLHTHESCIKEIETCQLFILIIGGRFGGEYHLDTSKSVVNAEYEAAKHLKLPVFTFIKREVYEDHRQYTHNKKQKPDIYNQFFYSAIDKQEYAGKVFEFINDVRKNDINNAIFSFDFGRQIREILLKQLAGMFYDFLWQRQRNIQQEKTVNLLSDLTILGKKTEEIIEQIYKKVDQQNANKNLLSIQLETEGRRFWSYIIRTFNVRIPIDEPERIKILSEVKKDENWADYLIRTGRFIKVKQIIPPDKNIEVLQHEGSKRQLTLSIENGELDNPTQEISNKIVKYFIAYSKLSESKREEILMGIE